MNLSQQINEYIASLPAPKRAEMEQLHQLIQQWIPGAKQWFLDWKDSNNKTVTNPNIGYGAYTIQYANGTTKEFYQVGLSANTSGISVYIMGIPDRQYLPQQYAKTIGKATVTGYCIKFRSLKDIHTDVLKAAILDGLQQTKTQ